MYSSSLLPYQRETRNKKKRNYACGKSGNNWFATFQACLNIVIQEEKKIQTYMNSRYVINRKEIAAICRDYERKNKRLI